MWLHIPLGQIAPNCEQETEIAGIVYVFEFEFLASSETWLLHIYSDKGEALCLGIVLKKNIPLLVDPSVLHGQLFFLADAGTEEMPALELLKHGQLVLCDEFKEIF